MILQVHDEIIFEVNTDDPDDKRLKEFARDIKGIMDNCIELSVPMLVDVKCGTSWADMNKITIN
jgi:DNA polymerase-1